LTIYSYFHNVLDRLVCATARNMTQYKAGGVRQLPKMNVMLSMNTEYGS